MRGKQKNFPVDQFALVEIDDTGGHGTKWLAEYHRGGLYWLGGDVPSVRIKSAYGPIYEGYRPISLVKVLGAFDTLSELQAFKGNRITFSFELMERLDQACLLRDFMAGEIKGATNNLGVTK